MRVFALHGNSWKQTDAGPKAFGSKLLFCRVIDLSRATGDILAGQAAASKVYISHQGAILILSTVRQLHSVLSRRSFRYFVTALG